MEYASIFILRNKPLLLSMFHVKQWFKNLTALPIHELVFYVFVITIPIHIRTILNPGDAYIGYYFSYHKSIFIYVSDVAFLALIVCWILFKSPGPRNYWWILPVFYGFLRSFHVEQFDLAIYSTLRILEVCFIIYYLSQSSLKTAKNAIYILIGLGITVSLLAFAQFHMKHSVIGEYVPNIADSGAATLNVGQEMILRAYGTMPHPNVLGGFTAICISLLFYVSRETRMRLGIFLTSILLYILSCGLLVTYSRTAWFAAVASALIYLTYQVRQKAYMLALYWLIFLVVSCGTLAYFYRELVFPRTAEIGNNSAAIEYRNMFNTYGLNAFKENALFGVGPGQYIPALQSKVTLKEWQYQPPHNVLLMFLAEYGIIGLLVALVVLLRLSFTWNTDLRPLSILLVPTLFILSAFDHYLITIVPTIFITSLAIGLLLNRNINVPQQ